MFAHLEPITVMYDLHYDVDMIEIFLKSSSVLYECRTYLTVVVGFKLRHFCQKQCRNKSRLPT